MATSLRLLGVVVLAVGVTALAGGDEKPPWQRELKGEDAKKAAALEKQIGDFETAGKFAATVKPAEALLRLRQKGQGDNHWRTADATRRLEELKQAAHLPEAQQQQLREALRKNATADSLFHLGKYRDAEPLLRKALDLRLVVLGPKHHDTATNCDSLAQCLGAMGNVLEAEPLYRSALAVREEVLGSCHPYTAVSCNNLAANLLAQGRYRDAEPLLRKSLAHWEKILGPKHLDVATGNGNLAAILHAQGKERDAEAFFRKALAIREEVLGPRHPDVARNYNNLAFNLNGQGRYRDADPLCRRALALREEVLGPKHPDVAQSCINLAANLDHQERYRDAEPLLRRALAIWLEAHGPNHPDTAVSYNNLAVNLASQGRHRDADPLLRKAMAALEGRFGPKHPDTAVIYHTFARNLDRQIKAPEAESWYRKALAIFEEKLGSKHTHTLSCCNSLAFNLNTQGKAGDAELLHRRTLAIREKALGPKHHDTATSYSILACSLDALGKARDAEVLHRKVLAIRLELLGPRHPETATSNYNLASNLQSQGRYRHAEPYWHEAVAAQQAARLRLAATGMDRAAATRIVPHGGLALCLVQRGSATDAWRASEQGLARGLLDDLTAINPAPERPNDSARLRTRSARLEQLDRDLLPLLIAEKLDDVRSKQRDELVGEREKLQQEIDIEAADLAGQEVVLLDVLQPSLARDAALVFWVDQSIPVAIDPGAFHYACVVRRHGVPAWVRLPGRGPDNAWTEDDDRLPRHLREALAARGSGCDQLARDLYAQRLEPLKPHLAATADRPAITRLIAIPVGVMAGVPLEALTNDYDISYAPSGTIFARLAEKHRPLRDPTLLALGDPVFAASQPKRSDLPPHGLLALQVEPGSNAFQAGLRDDDVLLAYAGTDLKSANELKVRSDGAPVSARAWRDGKARELNLAPGKLGVVFHKDPAPIALQARLQLDTLLASTRGTPAAPLPGSRREVQAVAGLFPKDRTTVLLGSEASEQRLDELDAAGRLKDVRILHFATHGLIDPASAHHSALLLAGDRLPDEVDQVKQGKKVYTGRLTVQALADWKLDADLVTLSACETGLGQESAGDGFLGFAHMLFKAGARSLVVSLWKVDDTATALLMTRFYQNLLGQRAGLASPLPRAKSLAEAKQWLRSLSAREAEKQAQGLPGVQRVGKAAVPPDAKLQGDRPYAHPYYWAAFILIGDPD